VVNDYINLTLFFGLPAAALAFWLVTGLWSGKIQAKNGRIARVDQPITFWICVALYGFFFAIFAFLYIRYMWCELTGRT
jgi:hypothetical protein